MTLAPSWRDRILPWVAPALLVLVAGVQIVRVQTLDQSAWSGVGFGMFAQYEAENTRAIRARDGRGEVITLSQEQVDAIQDAREELLVVPTAGNAERLATRIAEETNAPDGVIVEVWGVHLDRDPWTLEFELMTSGSSADVAKADP